MESMKKNLKKLFICVLVFSMISGYAGSGTVYADHDSVKTLKAEASSDHASPGYRALPGEFEIPIAGKRDGRFIRGLSQTDIHNLKKYNGKEMEKLPPVRDQGPYGTCWAFATIGAIESDLIHDGAVSRNEIDLSELHLAYYFAHYNDPKGLSKDRVRIESTDPLAYLGTGGNPYTAARVLTSLVGSVKETDAPYSSLSGYKPGTGDAVSKDYAQVRNFYIISYNELDAIKSAILAHGGVATMYYENSSGYNSEHNSYCHTDTDINHTIVLVGWDDEFPKDHFTIKPKGDGAWLVRNSWGSDDYEHSGYFWISYYDAGLLAYKGVVAIDASLDLYDNCYAYDRNPLSDQPCESDSGMVIEQEYSVAGGETIRAVGFEMLSANVNAEITVTNKLTGKVAKGSVTTSYSGFYTAALNSPLDVKYDADVIVSIKYTTSDNSPVRFFLEEPKIEGSFGALIFTAECDKGCTIDGEKQPCDSRIKLYTDRRDIPTTKCSVSFNPNGGSGKMSPQSMSDGQATTLNANTFTKSGYSFTGWNTKADGSGISYGNKSKITVYRDTILYAQWKAIPKTSIAKAKITLSKSEFTYNAKKQKPTIKKVVVAGKTLRNGTDYSATWSDASSKNAGTYSITLQGKGLYKGQAKIKYKIKKASNSLKVSAKSKTVKIKYSALRTKAQSIKPSAIYKFSDKKKTKGTVTYSLVSAKKSGKSFKKSFSADKNTGQIKAKKGLKKGSYKLTVNVSAGDKNHKTVTNKVSFTVKIS